MEISSMRPEDYDEVFALWRATPGMGLNNIDDTREGIGRYLRRNPATCFVAREGAALVGVILCGHDGRRGFIHHTAVRTEFRNRGIGKTLVDRALDALRAEGIAKVALVVFAGNELGNGFWERIGFAERTDIIYRNKVIAEGGMVKFGT